MSRTNDSKGEREAGNGGVLVDSDVHPDPLYEDIASYVDDPYRRDVDRLLERLGPLDLYDREMGTVEEYPADSPETIREQLCEGFGVDYPVLTPLNSLLEARNPRKDLLAPLMRATNDWLLDYHLDADGDFYGCAQVSSRTPEAAAEEIDRIGDEEQIVGVLVYHTAASPPLGDPEYDVLYRAAEDNDLPIAYHGGTSQLQYGFPRLDEHCQTWFEAAMFAHPFAQQVTLTSLTSNGAFEKFPDLEFVFLEAGVSWVIYQMYRLNNFYSKRRKEVPLLEASPEEYIKDRCYFTTQPLEESNDPRDLQQALELVGSDSIMFASDYPHWDFDAPDIFTNHSLSLEEADRKRIHGENAIDVFGLE